MKTEELLEKIDALIAHPNPDKEEWFDLLYGNLTTITHALAGHKQVRLGALQEAARIASDYDGKGMDSRSYYDQGGDAARTRKEISQAILAHAATLNK